MNILYKTGLSIVAATFVVGCGGDGDGSKSPENLLNEAPIAIITDISIDAENTIFDGTESYDTDGEIIDYSWFDENELLVSGSSPILTKNNYNPSNHTIKLVVTDDEKLLGETEKKVPDDSLNNPPVADPISVSVVQDTSINIPLIVSDPDGDAITLFIVSQPINGTATLNGDGSVEYIPNSNYIGTDSFTFKGNDGELDSNIETVSINVTKINEAPIAVNIAENLQDDQRALFTLIATDGDNDPLTYLIVDHPSNGTVTILGNHAQYHSNSGYYGADSFTYKANDGIADSNIATATIIGVSLNHPPEITGIPRTNTSTNFYYSFLPTATDIDGDTLIFSIMNKPSWASFNTTTGELSGTPVNSDRGTSYNIIISVSDGELSDALDPFSIEVLRPE